MMGLRKLFRYPSQVVALTTAFGVRHRGPQKGRTVARRKKGNQQMIKDPVMMARVRAAFRSRPCARFSRALFSVDFMEVLRRHSRVRLSHDPRGLEAGDEDGLQVIGVTERYCLDEARSPIFCPAIMRSLI